jgi:hypothetical protein
MYKKLYNSHDYGNGFYKICNEQHQLCSCGSITSDQNINLLLKCFKCDTKYCPECIYDLRYVCKYFCCDNISIFPKKIWDLYQKNNKIIELPFLKNIKTYTELHIYLENIVLEPLRIAGKTHFDIDDEDEKYYSKLLYNELAKCYILNNYVCNNCLKTEQETRNALTEDLR